MVTYDILILAMILALLTGLWIGVLVACWILKEIIKKNKTENPNFKRDKLE